MAYQISDAKLTTIAFLAVPARKVAPLKQFPRVTASIRSMQVHAWIAVLALALARWVQSLRSNLLPSNVHQKASV